MTNPAMNPITEDDIANFLVNTPDFFERHAELLSAVKLTSPHSRRAISLQERQAEMMREKIRALDDSVFEALVRRGFSERRKQLRNLLPEFKTDWEKISAALGVPPTVRAEQLTPSQWESLAFTASPKTAQHGAERFDVVDENDQVLRSEFRDIIHVNNLRHRAAH